jgi:hypothetical protein
MSLFIALGALLTVIIIAYGPDVISLLRWIMAASLNDRSPVSVKVPEHSEIYINEGINKTTSQKANDEEALIDELLANLSSSDSSKRLLAEALIKECPQIIVEEKLLDLISNSTSHPETANSAAELLLQSDKEEIIPLLAQFFSQKDKGIAGFLDDRDYNKVVNLFD